MCSGVACDIRSKGDGRLDLALIYSKTPCTAGGVFTQNDLKAAPVKICQQHLKDSSIFHAIVINSGNANACTGQQGLEDASSMAEITAMFLRVPAKTVFVCSTGRIGQPLPMKKMEDGIKKAVDHKSNTAEAGYQSLQAILTNDSCSKSISARFFWQGRQVTLSAIAKGGGMIQPNMATVIACILTDACIEGPLIQKVITSAVSKSFNRISVDGDMSTNDTVLLLANGLSEVTIPDEEKQPLYLLFAEAVNQLCTILSEKIISDGKHVTKVVEINIKGASSDADAEKGARAIANSLLVKTSWYGNDPNWGRIVHALGYAGLGLSEERLDLSYHKRSLPIVLAQEKATGDKQFEEAPVLKKGMLLSGNRERWKKW